MYLQRFFLLSLTCSIPLGAMQDGEVSQSLPPRPLGNNSLTVSSPNASVASEDTTPVFFRYPKGKGWLMARCPYPVSADGTRPRGSIWCLYPPKMKKGNASEVSGKPVPGFCHCHFASFICLIQVCSRAEERMLRPVVRAAGWQA